MRSRLVGAAGLAIAVAVVPGWSQTRDRAPHNAAEFDTLFQEVKNWGRWGKDDQLGSSSLVTAAKRKQAVALVKDGTTVSLLGGRSRWTSCLTPSLPAVTSARVITTSTASRRRLRHRIIHAL